MNRIAEHFRSPADPARVTRVWAALDHRLERSRRRRPFVRGGTLAVAVSVAAAGLLYFGIGLERARPRAGAEQVLELPDGSRVEHAANDRIAIESVAPERIVLRMTHGRAKFHIARNHARSFLTHVAGYTIRVVGTEYVVEVGSASLRVEVTRGEVEVRHDAHQDEGGNLWRLHAGETWSSSLPSTPAPESPATAESPAQSPPTDTIETTDAASPATPSAEVAQFPPQPSSPPSTRAANARQLNARTPRSDAAAVLFQRAQEARAAGLPGETARLLGELVHRYPNDPRAGIAAFQLGRMHLDSGDPKSAMKAFEQAESAGNSFKEQVAARRVQALEQLGDFKGCRAARAAFLQQFPGGLFAEVVRHRCP